MKRPIPAVILAGGLSRRMGGGNKALSLLAGETLLTHVLRRLRPQCGAIAINANGDAEQFGEYGLPVIADGFTGYAGPLAGVLAGMEWAAGQGADRVISVSVDTPFLPDDLVWRLREAEGRSGIALAASPDEGGGCAIIRPVRCGRWRWPGRCAPRWNPGSTGSGNSRPVTIRAAPSMTASHSIRF